MNNYSYEQYKLEELSRREAAQRLYGKKQVDRSINKRKRRQTPLTWLITLLSK